MQASVTQTLGTIELLAWEESGEAEKSIVAASGYVGVHFSLSMCIFASNPS